MEQRPNKSEPRAAGAYTSPYELEGRIPARHAILYGLQHVLAMFVGNLTPVLLITGPLYCNLDSGLQLKIIQSAMLIAGIVTLVQLITIGPVGARLPIVMGTSASFLGVCQGLAQSLGGGVFAYGAILGASCVGGLFEGALGFALKPLRKFFPPLVTGTVVMAVGLSLIGVGINSFGGGNNNGDFGSLQNLLVGSAVVIVIVVLKHFTKGVTSSANILFAIIIGYVVCAVMGLLLPTTYEMTDPTTQETVTKTCSWVLDFSRVKTASWFAVPSIMPVKMVFDFRAIIPMCIMFIVATVDTIGATAAITGSGLGREATDKELSGSVICDGLGSTLASFFGVLPNTSFSQNAGLVAMTKVVNLFSISFGAVFLILCGLLPKLAAVVQSMPQSVLGGAAVMMFASIIVSGIKLVTRYGVSNKVVTVVSVSIGLGFGLGANSAVLAHLPEWMKLVFGGSGIVPATLFAILLNILIPEDKPEKA